VNSKSASTKPIVFAGPSLFGAPRSLLNCIDLRAPVRRGDLSNLIESEVVGTALLVDGLFGTSLAVTGTECRDLISKGWLVAGSSSMGALRAAELYSLGMIGFGDVYQMLRLGIITSDAELAVPYDPHTYEELGFSLVQVRAAIGELPAEDVSPAEQQILFEAARSCYWMERTRWSLESAWKRALRQMQTPSGHPKRRDALYALRCITARSWLSIS